MCSPGSFLWPGSGPRPGRPSKGHGVISRLHSQRAAPKAGQPGGVCLSQGLGSVGFPGGGEGKIIWVNFQTPLCFSSGRSPALAIPIHTAPVCPVRSCWLPHAALPALKVSTASTPRRGSRCAGSNSTAAMGPQSASGTPSDPGHPEGQEPAHSPG